MLKNYQERLKRSARFRLVNPALYFSDVGRLWAQQLGEKHDSKTVLHTLLITDNLVYTSQQQFAPMFAYRSELRNRFGLAMNQILAEDVLKIPRSWLQPYQLVIIKRSFESAGDEVVHFANSVRSRIAPSAKLVYFDGDDDLCIQWPDLLSITDLYVKKHVFADLADYQRPYEGKSNLTNYIAKHYGFSFSSNIIPRSEPVPDGQLGTLHLGWNIGLDDKIRECFEQASKRNSWPKKDYDVICRASVIEGDWMYELRAGVVPRLRELEPQLRVLTPEKRVSMDKYHQEMLCSRMCVSPFGYGEICWRDFEAILNRCLLIKPDMSHVRTNPNVFVAGETYVPVAWDFSDLAEKCRYYAEHTEEREAIVERAYSVLSDYYQQNNFIDDFGALLQRIGV